MRSNGLPAARFDVLRDVDQLVSARLLQLLGEAGIAAYARQRPNSIDPTRVDIVDRLWVDASRRDEAQALVDEHLPALLDRDEDALFAEIVAHWDEAPDGPVGHWPVQEDTDDDRHHEDDGSVRRRLVRPASDAPVPPVAPGPPPVEDTDDHFVPPPPPPLPRLQKATAAGLAGVIAGIAFLVAVWVFGLDVDTWLEWTALLIAIAGGVSLIVHMGERLPPEEAGPDDGAVV